MAKKFETHYIQLLGSDKPSFLSVDDLKLAIHYSSEIRGVWGEEYVDFHIEKGVIYPTKGSFNLLGCSEARMTVGIKEYSLEEFIGMLKRTSATKFILLVVNNKPIELAKIFTCIQITYSIDYPKMVTDLERRRWLSTCRSLNVLSTDERRFTLKAGAEKIDIRLKDYISETYEVDSLGTSFWDDLTKGIEKLWSSHLKATPADQQSGSTEKNGET